MKKILVLLLAAGMFTACNNDKGVTRDDDRGNTRDDRNRERGDDNYDNRGDDNYDDPRTKKNISKAWTNADRNEWRTACNQQIGQSVANARELCDCVLTKLEAEYSNYREADAKGGEAAGRRMMEECVQMSGGGTRQYGGDGYENDEDY